MLNFSTTTLILFLALVQGHQLSANTNKAGRFPDPPDSSKAPTPDQQAHFEETTPTQMNKAVNQGQALGKVLSGDAAVDNASVRQQTEQALAGAAQANLQTLKDLEEEKLTPEQAVLQQLQMSIAAKAGFLEGLKSGPRTRGNSSSSTGQQSSTSPSESTPSAPQAGAEAQAASPSFPSAQEPSMPWSTPTQRAQQTPAGPPSPNTDSQIVILAQPFSGAAPATGGPREPNTVPEALGDASSSSLQLDESTPSQNMAQSPEDANDSPNSFANQLARLNQLGAALDKGIELQLAKNAAAKKSDSESPDKTGKNPGLAQNGAGANAAADTSQVIAPTSDPSRNLASTPETRGLYDYFTDTISRLTGNRPERAAALDPEVQRKLDSLQGNVQKLQGDKNSLTLVLTFVIPMLAMLIAAPLTVRWARRRKSTARVARRGSKHKKAS